MKTFILKWRPSISSYKVEDFEDDMHYLDYGEFNWSVWDHDRARSGDNFYMVKCGEGHTGIVMKGFFVSAPYEGDDWSGCGRQVFYMDLRPTCMIHPDRVPIISTEMLSQAIPGFEWDGGHSGLELPDEYARTLDRMWDEHVSCLGDVFDDERASLLLRPEAGIDDAVSLASDALYDKRDPDGRPSILHNLAIGMAGRNDLERICGFLLGVQDHFDWGLGGIRDRGFSESVADTLELLYGVAGMSEVEDARRLIDSGDTVAITVRRNELMENLKRKDDKDTRAALEALEAAMTRTSID